MISLTYDADTIELPNPQLGDVETRPNPAKINRSMNGTLWVTKRGVNTQYNWNFEKVDREKIKELEDFLRVNRGRVFAIVNHKGVNFAGKITANLSSTDNARGCSTSSGSFTLNIEKIA